MASSTKVEVAFELTVGDTPYFRLNDPVKGKLNNTNFRLGGPIWIDITDKVAAVNVKRGKNRELERYSAGSAGVTLHNEDRTFDPLNESSPYVGNIIPRRGIRITTASFPRFTGVIEDWNLDYDVSGKSDASIVAADAFTLLAQQSLTAGTPVAQSSGERIEAVLSMPTVAWPLQERNIDTGSAQVGADVYDTQESALTYLQKVEASEQGQLFMDRQGNVRFVNGAVTPTSGEFTTVATNLVTNPSFESTTGSNVNVRTNLITNPSFETNTTGWSAFNSTLSRVTSESYIGSASLQAVATGAGYVANRSNISPSTTYTGSAWVKGQAGKTFIPSLVEYTSALVYVGETNPAPITATGSWQRISVTRTMGSTAGITDFRVRNLQDGTFFVDATQLEFGATASDYFDGSTAASGDFTYAWSGTANASTSFQRGVTVTGVNNGSGAWPVISSTEWASTGSKSMRWIVFAGITQKDIHQITPYVVGKTYTVKAKVRIAAPFTGVPSLNFGIRAFGGSPGAFSTPILNQVGVQDVSLTFVMPAGTTSAFVRVGCAAAVTSGELWVDDLIVVEGNYTDGYFDGDTQDTIINVYSWTGTPNASTSIQQKTNYPLFSDTEEGIPYVSATVSYGTELLYNQVQVTSPLYASTKNNEDSQRTYGITTTDVDTLLSTQNSVESLAQFWVNKYGEPEYRFQDLEILLESLSGDDQETVLNIELGDIVTIKFTPNGVGAPIERYGQVNKIEDKITADRHTIVFGFGSLQYAFLVLDDVGFGILDQNALAF
jgi:hypothetical protein